MAREWVSKESRLALPTLAPHRANGLPTVLHPRQNPPLAPPVLLLLLLLLLLVLVWGPHLCSAAPTLCFEKLSNTGGLYLQEHPLRGRAVLAQQTGKLFLYTLPAVGSGRAMKKISTFLDLTDTVRVTDETGLLSFAFHPRFAANGRFFVSYICDSNKHPSCKAPCGCNPGVGCTVGEKGAGCSSVTIVAEYSAGKNPLRAIRVGAREVRRIYSFARPFGNHNGGHIFFGKDGMLYYTSGDGGSQGDPFNMAQNGKSNFGKILRLNVDKAGRGRNFSVPWNNPFVGTGNNPLVFALGLRNPWRCHQHPASGVMVCGDVGGSEVEEINVIRPGWNYEWGNYEGDQYHKGQSNPKRLLGKASGPLFSYTHNSLGGGCIIGGVFYTSAVNPCLRGKYLYADHSGPMWLATIGRSSSSTQRVSFTCSPKSPKTCPPGGDGSNTEWGGVNSWAADLAGNAYLVTDDGVFRITRQAACGYSC